jgi:hypothetical protein
MVRKSSPWYYAAIAVLLGGLLWLDCTAQTPAPPNTPTALSEAETLRLEVIQLRAQLASSQQQLAKLQQQMAQQDYNSTVQTIQAAHPGFALNPQTGQLVPTPKPTPPPAKPTTPPAAHAAPPAPPVKK